MSHLVTALTAMSFLAVDDSDEAPGPSKDPAVPVPARFQARSSGAASKTSRLFLGRLRPCPRPRPGMAGLPARARGPS